MPDEQGRLSHAEAAAQLGVSERTLRAWRERGLIGAEEEPQGLNTIYWYTAGEIATCRQRVSELRAQRQA